jgi:16S rRNA (adenine1518-N6/adenine1519-N6)-dimethyltransferase
MTTRDPFARYLERMAAIGFRPSSTLGQNFLLDPTLHRWLADAAAAGPHDTVIEVGVGLGFLTRELCQRAGSVLGVEIDARLLQLAQAELGDQPNLRWVLGDALGGPGHALHPEIAATLTEATAAGGRALLVANLPYAVAGPLLAEVAAAPSLPARAILLVQRELAERIAAPHGSAEYGSLSVTLQCLFAARVLRQVSPQVFRPRPKVWSAVLQLDRHADLPPDLVAAAARRSLGVFVRQLFQQRRKVLRTTLAQAAAAIGRRAPSLPAQQGQLRAEQLPPAAVLALWRSCAPAAD